MMKNAEPCTDNEPAIPHLAESFAAKRDSFQDFHIYMAPYFKFVGTLAKFVSSKLSVVKFKHVGCRIYL